MSRAVLTDPGTIIIGTLILLVTCAILFLIFHGEYTRNKQDIEKDEEIEHLKAEVNYWKYQALHPRMQVTLEGKGWEELPDEKYNR